MHVFQEWLNQCILNFPLEKFRLLVLSAHVTWKVGLQRDISITRRTTTCEGLTFTASHSFEDSAARTTYFGSPHIVDYVSMTAQHHSFACSHSTQTLWFWTPEHSDFRFNVSKLENSKLAVGVNVSVGKCLPALWHLVQDATTPSTWDSWDRLQHLLQPWEGEAAIDQNETEMSQQWLRWTDLTTAVVTTFIHPHSLSSNLLAASSPRLSLGGCQMDLFGSLQTTWKWIIPQYCLDVHHEKCNNKMQSLHRYNKCTEYTIIMGTNYCLCYTLLYCHYGN